MAVLYSFHLYFGMRLNGIPALPARLCLSLLVAVRQMIAIRSHRQLTERLYDVQNRLAHQVHHDSLTALPNRVLFAQRLDEAIAVGPFVLIFVDLDDFKEVNDRFGHAGGDELLCAVGEHLRRCIGDGDTLARIGGDEFAILIGGEREPPEVVADRIRVALRAPFAIHGSSKDLLVLNPGQGVPTLADREVVLTEAQIMIEYLDERYPHPPLMPVEPAARARLRSALMRMRQDLFPLVATIRSGPAAAAQKARKALLEALPSIAALITPRGHFLTGDFNSADCAWATLLWRLPSLGIKPGPELKVLHKYAEKLCARPAFHQSLTEAERALPR